MCIILRMYITHLNQYDTVLILYVTCTCMLSALISTSESSYNKVGLNTCNSLLCFLFVFKSGTGTRHTKTCKILMVD